jgi:hypothetical protein
MITSVDLIRKQSSDRIDSVKNHLIELVEEWSTKLKSQIISNVSYE